MGRAAGDGHGSNHSFQRVLQHSSLCHMTYDWPSEFSCSDVEGLVFMLFSLLVCFPVQAPELLCQWQEQDEDGKDAGEGRGCLF